MNTKQLQYVLTLAREGSFSRASETLNITQPSLSQYIKKIEKEIGVDLFNRANGEVRLTDAGRVYLDAGRKILELEHRMELQFADLAENRTGSLVVGAAPYRAAGMLPEVAKRFQELHPGIHLVVREGTTAELSEGMEHGEYDLCLTMLPVDERLFCYEKLLEEELVLAVPAGFPPLPAAGMPGRRYPAVEARQIQNQPFVMLTELQFMQRRLNELAADYQLSLRTAAVVKSLEAQIEMVRAGVGMALVPTGIERFCSGDEVRFYSFVPALPRREVVLMWRKGRELPRVLEELKTVFQSVAW